MLPDGHLRNFQGQQQLANSVYFHLGRHMDARIQEALRWVFFTIIRADVVGQEAEALWADFMNMTPFFAKTDAVLRWWIICHMKPKTMISMWQETLQQPHGDKVCTSKPGERSLPEPTNFTISWTNSADQLFQKHSQ